jgi:hypothetical protein
MSCASLFAPWFLSSTVLSASSVLESSCMPRMARGRDGL